jgi:Uncharacterised protein family (UPF0175)
MSVLISDDILQSAQISEMELKREVAILLLRQEKLGLNKARELADMPMIEVQKELTKWGDRSGNQKQIVNLQNAIHSIVSHYKSVMILMNRRLAYTKHFLNDFNECTYLAPFDL